jgi:hypothetical protein
MEVGLLKFMSVEIVPVFVVNDQPPSLNFSRHRRQPCTRKNRRPGSHGRQLAQPGFWLEGKSDAGLRTARILTKLTATPTKRKMTSDRSMRSATPAPVLLLQSGRTRAGALFHARGRHRLGCRAEQGNRAVSSLANATSYGRRDVERLRQQQIIVQRSPVGIYKPEFAAHPVQLMFRFSLGITID